MRTIVRRIDPDVFYDRDVIGAVGVERVGHRGLAASWFHRREDPLAHRPHFMVRAAQRPWVFASVLFGFGFFAVFVRQADIITQIILGAPIFEEMLKFGLALVLALALTGQSATRPGWDHPAWLALRLPISLAVGAGFGWLEHLVTYSSESASSYAWRVAFHSFATATSMAAFHAALPSPDVRTRWLALLPAIFVHYLNNYAALVLGIGSLGAGVLGFVAGVWSNVLVIFLGVMLLAFLAFPGWVRELLQGFATRLPVETARGA